MFAPAGAPEYSSIELARVAKQLDFYNLQGYDLHGTWETSTNHQAALFESRQDPDFGQGFSMEPIVDAYLDAQVPARFSWPTETACARTATGLFLDVIRCSPLELWPIPHFRL